MTILELMRANPYLAMPSDKPTCPNRAFSWDGGYFVKCSCCGRIGPVPIMLHVPHNPPAMELKEVPLLEKAANFLTKLLLP